MSEPIYKARAEELRSWSKSWSAEADASDVTREDLAAFVSRGTEWVSRGAEWERSIGLDGARRRQEREVKTFLREYGLESR